MEVIFSTNRLRRCFEESDRAARQWGEAVGRKYITRINELYAARNFQQAYRIRSMRMHPLKGSKRGEVSIYLTGKWRLIVAKGDTEERVMVKEVSNHYGD